MQKRIWRSVLVLAAALILVPSVCLAGATYDKVMETGVVRAGLMYNSIPAAYFNEKNEWVGFDV
ncbi:MAG: amino acid ABC transporter substrate-binding protein, partial [Deltaproteobacteria bacterium]|nr:amino acid ABC transporter substrate-binding protein [Deltaproteobacteria bacterium]